jgi:hypothetical protein
MNRKGDLPSAMLLIMAITASIAVLIFFVTFDNNFNGQSKNLSLLVQNIELNEKYVIDKAAVIGEESILACVDCSDTPLNAKFKDAANKKDLSYTGAGNLFAKIRNGEFSFIKNGENYILEIKGLFVTYTIGENSINRKFNLKIEYDKTGKLLSKEINYVSE